ncbi:hypothetical protein [Aeromonas veronii]
MLIVDDGTPGDGLLTQGEIDGNGAGVQLTEMPRTSVLAVT